MSEDAKRLKDLRDTRKAEGKCPHCEVSVVGTGFIYCLAFRQDFRDRRFKRRNANLKRERAKDRAYHAKNRPASRARSKRRYDRLKAAGLCVKCGIAPVKKMLHCLACRQQKNSEYKARTAKGAE